MSAHPNYTQIVDAINEHPFKVAYTLAALIINLGSKAEWSMEDNYYTTEAIAQLAVRIGLPRAHDQTAVALEFYREAGTP